MIASVLREFQNMMTMRFVIFRQRLAVLTNSAVSLVNPLFQRYPTVKRHPAKPGKPQIRKFIYRKSSHTLPRHKIEPYLAVPDSTKPYQAKPNRTATAPDRNSPLPQSYL